MRDDTLGTTYSSFSTAFDALSKTITEGRQAEHDMKTLVVETDPVEVAAELLAVMTEMRSWPMPEDPSIIPSFTPEQSSVIDHHSMLKKALESCQRMNRPSRDMLEQASMPVLEAIRDALLTQLEQLKDKDLELASSLSGGLFNLFLKMDEVHGEFVEPFINFDRQILDILIARPAQTE